MCLVLHREIGLGRVAEDLGRQVGGELARQGVIATGDPDRPAALIDLVTPNQATEYWIGFDNFYAITRYNRSSFYAMSVFQLAEALREERLKNAP